MARNGDTSRPPWPTKTLAELLPEDAIAKVVPVMNRIRQGKLDQIEGRKRILEILSRYREDLIAKEVLPEYLSYVLLSLALSGSGGELGAATLPGHSPK